MSSAGILHHMGLVEADTMKTPARIISIGLAILCAGGLIGMGFAHWVPDPTTHLDKAEVLPDPIERFGLGQNAFKRPRVKSRRTASSAEENVNYDIGKTRDGKRLLVPGEPAIKSERDALEAEEREQADYFGNENISQEESFTDYQNSMNPSSDR